MKQIASGRLAQVAGKYSEHAPMAAVCCNACRACVSTNLFALATTFIAGAGLWVGTFVKRRVRSA